MLRRRASLYPTILLPRLLSPINVLMSDRSLGKSLHATDAIVVTRTVAGKALPEDRDTPTLLPGRSRACFVSRPVWAVTILPVPTPDRAFEFARKMMSGKRLHSPLLATLPYMAPTIDSPLLATPRGPSPPPVTVVVRPRIVNV